LYGTVSARWVKRPVLLACIVALAGCSSTQVKRATYQVLRQGDCALNGFDEFCDRNFSAEYHQYERLRNDFLHERQWEARPEPATDPLAAL